MCSGGGSAATITMPDYSAYNNEFQLQKAAIEQSMNSGLQQKQQELTASLRNQEKVSQQVAEQTKLQAENTNAAAMRMATLIGTPPPEPTAQAPRVGSAARGISTSKGKGALRIGRSTAPVANSGGSGLNITTVSA